jgi:hypothetical protein
MSTSFLPPGSASSDVVDLTTARQARQSANAAWFCPTCDLVAEGFSAGECAYLAAVHDQIQHGSRQSALVMLAGVTPVPPPPSRTLEALDGDLGAGLGIGA